MNGHTRTRALLASVAVTALSVYTVGLGLAPPLAAAPPAPKGDFAWPGALPPWFTAMPAGTGAGRASTTTQPRALPAWFAPGEILAGSASPTQDVRSGTPANVDADISQATASEPHAPYEHQYYVPFNDTNLWTLFDDKNTGLPGVRSCHRGGRQVAGTLNSSIFLIASSDRTVFYYDHWEDGYDDEPRIYGDTTEVGMLDAGVSKVFRDNIDPALVADRNTRYYDGRDRITVVGEEATVVRMAYPDIPGSVLAAAWEVPERADWGREYLATLGEDLDFNGATADDHDFSGLEIMAADPNTEIYYNGILAATLDPGETFFIDGANDGPGGEGVDSADRITATNDIQVQMMTGGCGRAVSAHGYTLQPVGAWGVSYWAPVPGFGCPVDPGIWDYTDADTDIYLHNPHPDDNTVTVTSNIDTVAITIPANSSVSVLAETGWEDICTGNGGAHIYSSETFSETFWGLAVVDTSTNLDTEAEMWDWGYSLVPESKLSSQVVVGYAPGNSLSPPTDNGNLAFVTAITDTVIYVDLDQDGLPDPFDTNGDGDRDDYDAWGVPEWDEPTSALGIPLSAELVLRVGDPNDRNLEGALIYTLDLDAKIAVAWGQDPCQALGGSPYLDLGYAVPPLSIPRLSKVDELAIDADLTGGVSPGDTITYTLVVHNNGRGVMNNVILTDPLPYTYTDFVVGSVRVTTPPPFTAIEYSDDGINFDDPESESIQALRVIWPSIGPGRTVTVAFRVQIRTDIPADLEEISNQAVVGSSDTDPIPSLDPDDPDDPDTDTPTGRPLLSIDKRVSPSTVQPGGRITYTLVVSNYGNGVALLTAITDVLPSWMEYVPHTLDLTWPIAQVEITTHTLTSTSSFHGNYADDFDLTATQTTGYAGNDGSLRWSTDWTEVNDVVPSDPISGEVRVRLDGDALSEPAHLWITDEDDDDSGVQRTMDLSDFVSPTLRYYVAGTVDSDGDDWYRLDVNGITETHESYNGLYAYREISLPLMAGNPAVTLGIFAEGGLEAGEWYRFDHIAISESDPFRVVTRTLVEEHTVLSYTTRTGTDPVLYDSLTGYMVITDELRLPVDRHGFVTATFQVQVQSPLTDGLTLSNTACTTSSNWLNVLSDPCDDATIQTQAHHALTITKTALPSPARIGGLLAYTVNYTITGNEAVESAVVSDTTPANTTFYSATPAPVAHPDVGDTGAVIWQVDGLWPPASGTTQTTGSLAMVVRVDHPLISGTLIHNAVIITDTTGLTGTDEVTTPVYIAPGLELIKTVEPERTVPNMPFTYTLRILNTGSFSFTVLRLIDDLPTADFRYILGSGRPADPDFISEPRLEWSDLVAIAGPLVPGASLDVAFQVTTPLRDGTYTNTATVEGECLAGILTDTARVPVDIVDPAVAVEKSVIGQDRDLGVHERVTFTIVITNVGPSEIDVLPLEDHHEAEFLRFVNATPHPEKHDDDGLLKWDDLTASGPCGLGCNLPPGEAFIILTVFETIAEGTTVNTAIVRGATDIYGNPADEVQDPHRLTPVILRYFRAVAETSTVRLEWATAMEVDCVGFYIYRDLDATIGGAQPIAYVPATGPGSTYSHVDRDVTPGQVHWYWLAEVNTGGEETLYGPVWAGVGPDGLPMRIYLPLIEKDWR